MEAPDAEVGSIVDTESISTALESADLGVGADLPFLDFDRRLIVVFTSISTEIIVEIDWS